MARILDGKVVRDGIAARLSAEISKLRAKPTLAIIQVGDKSESSSYIRQKKLFGEKIGARVLLIKFPETVSEEKIIERIGELNDDTSIHGIVIQLPLPGNLDKKKLINAVEPLKDVDGLGRGKFTPATAKGVCSLFDYYKIPIAGKKVTIVGRSALVGKPIAEALAARGAIITVCHRGTEDLAKEIRGADIVIVAVGHPKLVGRNHVRAEQIVIDVGINSTAGEKLEEEIGKRKIVGDVDFEAVRNNVSAISPVPGGVGPMTVASLFENLILAYKNQS